jgi:hypothetical protein
MIKRLCLALAGLFALVSLAQGAGTVPGFSLTPQFDLTGAVAPGCKLYVIQAGTTATPQNSYSDSGLTQLLPNPLTCDAAGRLPQFFVADGLIKVRLTKSSGSQIFVGDNLTVIGASSGGGGGGGSVDPTTIAATGDMQVAYGISVLSGWVRANGRTIGSATSGATERANADCQALFQYLWGADANLAVSGGRGVSAAADWAANKTIALPDWAGRALAGLDDMGAGAKGRLTLQYLGQNPTTLGASGGGQYNTILTSNLPPYTPTGSVSTSLTLSATVNNVVISGGCAGCGVGGGGNFGPTANPSVSFNTATASSSFTGTAQGGSSQPFNILPPMMLATIYLKL